MPGPIGIKPTKPAEFARSLESPQVITRPLHGYCEFGKDQDGIYRVTLLRVGSREDLVSGDAVIQPGPVVPRDLPLTDEAVAPIAAAWETFLAESYADAMDPASPVAKPVPIKLDPAEPVKDIAPEEATVAAVSEKN